ncbi:MAG: type I-E CRISPR-associated endoribonuclease Cas2e [Propionibacteriaceae bacterium]
MVVIVLSKVPSALRGHLTKWLMEVSAGVFVGSVSARVREQLWVLVLSMVSSGEALMIHSARNEQGMIVRNHRHAWEPVDFDGVTLMRRPPAIRKSDGADVVENRSARFRRVRRPVLPSGM